MKKLFLLCGVFLLFGFLACQKKSEKTVEEMGDTSSMKVMQAPNLNAIPQIPQSLPTILPSTLPAIPSTLPSSLPAKPESDPTILPSSQPLTW